MTRFCCLVLAVLLFPVGTIPTVAVEPESTKSSKQLLLAHYMPWYVAKPVSEQWGWHWTMNHFDPEILRSGRRELASHFYPLIGPYDSSDSAVLEYHLLLMKLAGIDGVVVDWYGLSDFRDYAVLHRNTAHLIDQIERLGMKFVICYEDQTIPALVAAQRLESGKRVDHAVDELVWLDKHWFKRECYVKIEHQPVLLSFGHAGLTNDEWADCLGRLPRPVAYFSEHIRREGAIGGFDWPVPREGISRTLGFTEIAADWPHAIPVVYPRFVDIYAEANVNDGYGTIADENGKTLDTTLQHALSSDAKLIQIATWNDWGEGTQIEPSLEFQYRDLEWIQKARRESLVPPFNADPANLRLPHELLKLRRMKTHADDKLNAIAVNLASGQLELAKRQIEFLAAQR